MREQRAIMGMPITLAVVGNETRAREALDAGFADLTSIDETFSTYKETSEMSRINRGELRLEDASQDMRWVMAQCDDSITRTRGYFNHHRPDGTLDPSGFVKGWAISRVTDIFRSYGFDGYLVEAGGDMQVFGLSEKGEPWSIGIRHPLEHDKVMKTFRLSSGAVATSGTYERGNHIYNPHTGKPSTELLSVTVVGPHIIDVDLFATAAFAMGDPNIPLITERREFAAVVVDRSGTVLSTQTVP